MDLLSSFRNLSIVIGICLNILCSVMLVLIFSSPIEYRFYYLLAITIFSFVVYMASRIGIRIEPITAIAGEYSDQNVLFALFEKPPLPQPNQESIPTISVSQLPLDHYLFLGKAKQDNRDKLYLAFRERYGDNISYLDFTGGGDKSGVYITLKAEIDERKLNKNHTNLKPLVIFAEKFDLRHIEYSRENIFFFVATDNINTPIKRRIVDKDIAVQIDPDSKVTLGYVLSDSNKVQQLYFG